LEAFHVTGKLNVPRQIFQVDENPNKHSPVSTSHKNDIYFENQPSSWRKLEFREHLVANICVLKASIVVERTIQKENSKFGYFWTSLENLTFLSL
jgi:hypothetical protein